MILKLAETSRDDGLRAYHLENGTVFTVNNKSFETMVMFEDKVLYEVVYKGYDQFGPVYEKTGVSYTTSELSELLQRQ